ncbi:Hypothetical protein CAP_5191 [Chondromyces apiculatus DSM 436]|uniref:Uncharacterized protein n=1 Tax=Chondromyces apiculatus DSM 436 TaxID=1192034 RepID=A0A017T5C1_9BACT|nr:Hypothetical protein CAP_5191 [Chondromyces apiculatus DSM 436]
MTRTIMSFGAAACAPARLRAARRERASFQQRRWKEGASAASFSARTTS